MIGEYALEELCTELLLLLLPTGAALELGE